KRATIDLPHKGGGEVVIFGTDIASTILGGLAAGMVLFIVSVGLSVTMGLMGFINLAHGGFAMLGGYVIVLAMNRWGLGFASARRSAPRSTTGAWRNRSASMSIGCSPRPLRWAADSPPSVAGSVPSFSASIRNTRSSISSIS